MRIKTKPWGSTHPHKLYKKATPSLSEGNGSVIHSRCSGGAWGSAPFKSEGFGVNEEWDLYTHSVLFKQMLLL